MPEDRSEMEAARLAGLARRHETREARAIRRAVAEEIAKALETEARSDYDAADDLRWAAAKAREIGSRDPA